MKRIISRAFVFFVILSIMCYLSCTEDPIDPENFGTIRGEVLDSEDNSPVANAGITTTPATNAILTDNAGQFVLQEIETGTYTVKATKSGYKTSSVVVEVKEGKTTTASILLSKSSSNNAPLPPDNPSPVHGAVDQEVNLTLSWSGQDNDRNDTLKYDIYLGNSGSAIKAVSLNQMDTTYTLENLSYSTTYHWQVIARDLNAEETNGPAWSFTTKALPNYPLLYASNVNGDYEIYSGAIDGSDSLQLTFATGRDWYPKMSPNKNKIAFTSDRDIESHIYTMDRDGSNVKRVTTVPVTGFNNYGTGFCWTSNGQYLLYGNYDKLYRIGHTGSGSTQIATAPADRHFRDLACSPLGNKIAAQTIGKMVYDSEIYIMDSNGSNATLLVDNQPGATGHPTFSPAGDKIAYYHDVSGHEVSSGRMLDARIFIVDIAGTDTTEISGDKPAGTNDLDPVWSPDGAKIVFTNVVNDDSAPPSVWIMDVDGKNRKKLYEQAQMPDWQ